jgi:hypothetical protein
MPAMDVLPRVETSIIPLLRQGRYHLKLFDRPSLVGSRRGEPRAETLKPKHIASATRIKVLFAAVAILFPLQYWFAKYVTEPYPALLLPSFEGARLDAAGRLAIENAEVVVSLENGATETISLRTLFAGRFGNGLRLANSIVAVALVCFATGY